LKNRPWCCDLVGNRVVDGCRKRSARHAIKGSELVILDADHVAPLNLSFRRAVHVNDTAKAVQEVNAGRKRIKRGLKRLRPDRLQVQRIRNPDCAADMWDQQVD
jgi:hypothetical protein